MTHLKAILWLVLGFCLLGAGEFYPGFHWLKVGKKEASGVQWNEQFLVTAAHVDFLPEQGVACPSGCDLQFVRARRDLNTVWREPKDWESIRVVGAVAGQGVVARQGRILPGRRALSSDSAVQYQLLEAKVEKGMSGGPVYGADGAVLGMVVAFIDPEELAKHEVLKNLSGLGLFLTTADIKREWRASGLRDEPEGPCLDGDCD